MVGRCASGLANPGLTHGRSHLTTVLVADAGQGGRWPAGLVAVDGTNRRRYREFIDRCETPDGQFRLTPCAEPSAYALCFAIFGLHLLGDRDTLAEHRARWDQSLRNNLAQHRSARGAVAQLNRDKAYLQLLTFTLSALAILGTLCASPLREEVLALLPGDVEAELHACGCLRGLPRSGNQAMFLGILLLHARDWLSLPMQGQLDRWVGAHLAHINRFGFWGSNRSMSHLQFQNGYHQYEIFEYLHTPGVPWGSAAAGVAGLADALGHFSPYVGGGGCYDYDAVVLLTGAPTDQRALLAGTYQTVRSEQNDDGGFCESRYVRPRSWSNIKATLQHIAAGTGQARIERIRWGANLLRRKHDRIHTHWSRYSRRWNESNLWDSWFRMLALARIETTLDPVKAREWGFIDYPGIGFHPCARGSMIS